MQNSAINTQTIDRLLRYCPESGKLFWKVSRGKAKAGSRAGSLNKDGYLNVTVFGRTYLAHRVAWLLHTGSWPDGYIDHISGDITDNRICNLRIAGCRENSTNKSIQTNSTSGILEVAFLPRLQKWRARISINRHRIYLGHFDNLLDAAAARKAAELGLGYHTNHGRTKREIERGGSKGATDNRQAKHRATMDFYMKMGR